MTIEISKTWQKLIQHLPEAQKRWYVAQKAIEFGWGGVERMHEFTGLSRTTIIRGIRELKRKKKIDGHERSRQLGGGRKSVEENDPKIVTLLRDILEDNTAGDPMSALLWTHKTHRFIADEIKKAGHSVSRSTIRRLLAEDGYTNQANKKDNEGLSHKDRDTQFKCINECVALFISKNQPVISVDAKKKEKVGEFKNNGKNWFKKGKALRVNTYDYPSLAVGVAIPYGMYDVVLNEGMVNVGTSYDTAEFAVESIRRWWELVGNKNYPNASELLICADGGGSNGSRNRLWKKELQGLSNELALKISICHYPPGTSKWNKIEHRMFSFISLNWQGRPLVNYETIVNLISNTTTRKGLKIQAKLDEKQYEKGKKISNKELKNLSIAYHDSFPRWNYTISPQITEKSF